MFVVFAQLLFRDAAVSNVKEILLSSLIKAQRERERERERDAHAQYKPRF